MQVAPHVAETFAREFVARGARHGAVVPAAVAAGVSTAGSSPYVFLRRPDMQAMVKRMLLEHYGELEITAQRTFEEIGRLAFSDPAELLDAEGRLLPLHKMTPAMRAAVASIDYETRMEGRGEDAVPVHTVKIRLWDKTAALKTLATHFKLINNDKDGLNALAGELAQQLRQGRERAQAARRGPLEPVEVVENVEEVRIIAPVNSVPSSQETDDEERLW